MGQDLEGPFRDGKPVWESLYRARGDEVSSLRPVFTGDVFDEVPLAGPTGDVRKRSVLVLQHPCSMRIDGVRLADKLLVAEVSNRTPLEETAWLGNFSLMPLPALRPGLASRRRDQAANFDRLHAVPCVDLVERKACLSAVGVNLLLQRWVHFSSRVVVPTWQFQATIAGEFDEADLIEDWCLERSEIGAVEATRECVEWLRDTTVSPTRQESLRSAQHRSRVRSDMRTELRRLRQSA
jgi:hypothetical protein